MAAACRMAACSRRRGARHQPDPDRDDRARRHPDGRRLRGYGSDAVAGVVNFIMKKDFEGVEVTSQYNIYWHENDFGGPGAVKLRDVDRGQGGAPIPAQFALPDDTVTDGEGKELSLMVGVNSGDGRGNITAYATVFDSEASCRRIATIPPARWTPTRSTSFVCGGSSTSARRTNFTRLVDLRFHGRHGDGVPRLQRRYGPVQLRPAQLLPAPRASLQPRRDGPLRVRRARGRLHPADVHRLHVGGADRPVRQLLRHDHDQVQQPVPAGAEPGRHRLRGRRDCGRTDVPMYIGRRNVEGGGRQQSFANSSFRRLRVCAGRSTTPGATTSRRSTRAAASTRRHSTTS